MRRYDRPPTRATLGCTSSDGTCSSFQSRQSRASVEEAAASAEPSEATLVACASIRECPRQAGLLSPGLPRVPRRRLGGSSFSSYASAVSARPRDRWAEWLAERRFGGDEGTRELFLSKLAATRDVVLDRAQLRAGEDLLDVGCGEGLIAFGALERGAGTVTFSDISSDLLDFCREAATDRGVLDRCRFAEAPARPTAE